MNHALAYSPITPDQTPLFYDANYFTMGSRTASPRPDPIKTYEAFRRQKIHDDSKQFSNEIQSLNVWQENWDGNNSAKPKPESIKNAKMWGDYVYKLMIDHNYGWRKPFISADEDGNVVLEWWYQDRNLTLDISEDEVIFSEIRDADTLPQITSDILAHEDISSKLKWLVLGIS